MIGCRQAACALLGGLMLVLAGAPAHAELSVLDYLGIRDGKDAERKADLRLYLGGVLEGLLTFNELNRSIEVNVLCIPATTTIELPSFQAWVDQAIEATRKEQSEFVAYAEQANISVMGLTALNREFACSTDEAPADPAPGASP